MDKLKDKVVLITGAGKGSGRILAEAFAQQGAIVAANDISPINVEEVVDQILAKGGRAQAYIDDVAKKVAAQNIINQVEDDFGQIDILINHAAVEPRVLLLDMDEWDWHRVLDVNLTGAFLLTQSAGRIMKERGGGIIVHFSAKPEPGEKQAAFLASKAALGAFVEEARREYAPHGIRVSLAGTEAEVLRPF